VAAPTSVLWRRRWLRVAASVAISGVMLWLAFRTVDPDQLLRLLESASGGWIATAMLLYWFELVVRVQRWRVILGPVKSLSFAAVANALIVGYAANNIIPARLGELVRADYIGRRYGLSRFSAASTIVIERVFDLAAVTVCAALGAALLLRSRASLPLPLLSGIVAVTTVVGLAFLVMYAANPGAVATLARRFPRLATPLRSTAEGLKCLRTPRLLASVVLLSLLAWFFNGAAMAAVLQAVGVEPDLTLLLLVIGASGVAVAVPSAPAGLGTLQFAFVSVVGGVAHNSNAGFLAALFVQFFLLGSVTLTGALVFASSGFRLTNRSDEQE